MNDYARDRAKAEFENLYGKRATQRRLQNIARELGAQNLTFADLMPEDAQKLNGVRNLMQNAENPLTLDDLLILGQYHKGIMDRDTRAAEFLRDTRGEKPKVELDVTTNNPLADLTDEELLAMRELLRTVADSDDVQGSEGGNE